jgi:hypothetical protein
MERTKAENEKLLKSLYTYRTILEVITIGSIVIGFPALIILGVCWGEKIHDLLFETDGGLTATLIIVILAIVAIFVTIRKEDNVDKTIKELENKLNK